MVKHGKRLFHGNTNDGELSYWDDNDDSTLTSSDGSLGLKEGSPNDECANPFAMDKRNKEVPKQVKIQEGCL